MLQAGIAKSSLKPQSGTALIGYGKRETVSAGVHDDLFARAMVLDDGQTILALCSIEICYLRPHEVQAIRKQVSELCGLAPENIFISTTHSHSAPAPHEEKAWGIPFAETVAKTIVEAYHNRQAAKIGIGAGMLIGYNINRRWLDRPADPALGIIRVDTIKGEPLAILGNYACHAVVMGYDNLLISGDWPGYASRSLEGKFGDNFVALFTQGGAGDVNPLTETVRQRLAAGHPVQTIGELTTYYGQELINTVDDWNIEDRAGGTFIECETIARAYVDEVLRIWKNIETQSNTGLWSEKVVVNAAVDEDEPPAQGLPSLLAKILPDADNIKLNFEISLFGIGDTVIVGHPGESFSESSIALRKHCQQMGYRYAMLISYANGSYGYLPPENAFAEGGYEVGWPLSLGISRRTQNRIDVAIEPILQKHL
jgi:hypothetical protein